MKMYFISVLREELKGYLISFPSVGNNLVGLKVPYELIRMENHMEMVEEDKNHTMKRRRRYVFVLLRGARFIFIALVSCVKGVSKRRVV